MCTVLLTPDRQRHVLTTPEEVEEIKQEHLGARKINTDTIQEKMIIKSPRACRVGYVLLRTRVKYPDTYST